MSTVSLIKEEVSMRRLGRQGGSHFVDTVSINTGKTKRDREANKRQIFYKRASKFSS